VVLVVVEVFTVHPEEHHRAVVVYLGKVMLAAVAEGHLCQQGAVAARAKQGLLVTLNHHLITAVVMVGLALQALSLDHLSLVLAVVAAVVLMPQVLAVLAAVLLVAALVNRGLQLLILVAVAEVLGTTHPLVHLV
tara:strand:- start:205 stop:609 length:405 start_codon:yes stop_codon:yes gene_type:complete